MDGVMTLELDVKRVALSLGALFGILHFAGVLAITLSGGAVAEYWMTIHHVKTIHTYLPLDISMLLIGTAGAVAVGTAIGALFVFIWNASGKSG
jgi:hypothetical protein